MGRRWKSAARLPSCRRRTASAEGTAVSEAWEWTRFRDGRLRSSSLPVSWLCDARSGTETEESIAARALPTLIHDLPRNLRRVHMNEECIDAEVWTSSKVLPKHFHRSIAKFHRQIRFLTLQVVENKDVS